MDRFDFVVIGAGAAGEAAANMARRRGASVAIVDRDLIGGSCSFWACIPSKSLLHSAAVHAGGGDYPWPGRSTATTTSTALASPTRTTHSTSSAWRMSERSLFAGRRGSTARDGWSSPTTTSPTS